MKRKTLIILSFLLLLYIVPAILAPSSTHVARQNEPNMTRDFSRSELNETIHLMDDGENGGVYEDYFWNYTWTIDGDEWLAADTYSVLGYFHDPNGYNFSYSIYARKITTAAYVDFYNFDTSSYTTTVTISSSGLVWYNGTMNAAYTNSTGWVIMRFRVPNEFSLGYMDYCHLNFMYYEYEWHDVATATLEFDTPSWQLIITAILVFVIPIDETLVNWLLIFLGLFMIPASTLYLVKGGKDGMSMNKFFYFIVAFMLGWGLLLGGIM